MLIDSVRHGVRFALFASCLALAATMGTAKAATAQAAPGSGLQAVHLHAYVDPISGNDVTAHVNDPDLPFKTLQAGIDGAQAEILSIGGGGTVQATVVALEGIYGPIGGHNGTNASGDMFPIRMRDSVHVKGVGSRRCIIRGVRTGFPCSSGTSSFLWPASPNWTGTTTGYSFVEVLVDANRTNVRYAPWFSTASPIPDVLEVFDGFTFQSGDVQFAIQTGTAQLEEPGVVVSNCLFDLRSGWVWKAGTPLVLGPTFGVAMAQAFSVSHYAYIDMKVLLSNNTFIFSQLDPSGPPNWTYDCLPNAVGVINFTYPNCGGSNRDCDTSSRGLANCGLINNVFRTRPYTAAAGQPMPMAMLGIDDLDTIANASGLPVYLRTNAYASSRVGSTNGGSMNMPTNSGFYTGFWSVPMQGSIVVPPTGVFFAGWDCGGSATHTGAFCGTACATTHTCTPASPPTNPAVEIYDGGANGWDPLFVGEFLSCTGLVSSCVDWRLLPESPLLDQGIAPVPGGATRYIAMANGTVFDLKPIRDVDPFEWEGEHYGNPRVVNGSPDIGFDEVHFLTMAGSYGNDSNSHNVPNAQLNPDAAPGQPVRYLIAPRVAGGVAMAGGDRMRLHYKRAPVSSTAWNQPPATLPRSVWNPSLSIDYDWKYVGFGPLAPRIWIYSGIPTSYLRPFSNPASQISFALFTYSDDECAAGPCDEEYFASQFVLERSHTDLLWSNLQAEYR